MKKLMMILTLTVLTGSNFFGHSLLNAMAEEPQAPVMNCYYKSIQIKEGDSLWTIAGEYCEDTDQTIPEYIEKLKQINGLKEDTIHADRHLTVMYMKEAE